MLVLDKAYRVLKDIDKEYAKKIFPKDRYRIEKALQIYFSTKTPPAIYFKQNPKKPIIQNLKIYEIDIDRAILKEKIFKRTKEMVKSGLIDEIAYLEKKYSRAPKPMRAIGIKETLKYLDGKINIDELIEEISINTLHLAKRQQTFNRTQFQQKISAEIQKLYEIIENELFTKE